MKENLPPEFKFQELIGESSLHTLQALSNPETWQALTNPDKELLAQLLINKGRHLLEHGDSHALAHFDKAAQIASHCHKTFYLIGKAYATQEHNVGCLRSALECYDRSLTISSSAVEGDVWLAFVELLLRKGELLSEVGYFQAAKEKCAAFYALHPGLSEAVLSELFWLWGRCYCLAGRVYGEAVDFYEALEKYRQAESKGLHRAEFWKNFGDTYFELAALLDRSDLYNQAIEYYQKSLKLSHDCIDTWYSLASSYLRLFEYSGSQSDFSMSDTCFVNTLKIDNKNFKAWVDWGYLLCEYGKLHGDKIALGKSCAKFEAAQAIEPNDARLFRLWGEALMYEGALSEDITTLRAAEKRLVLSLEMQPENGEAWYLYGCCLNEFGRYFGDARYYHQAIEKFNHGLVVDNEFPFLWHGIGLSNFALGDLDGDWDLLFLAADNYEKAIEEGAGKSLQCWNDWGVTLMRLAEVLGDKIYAELALDKFEKAMNLQDFTYGDEPDLELLYNYGCAFDFLGDFYEEADYYEKSIEALTKVLQIDPDYTNARYNLALTLSHLGELVMDVDCLHRAAEQFQHLIVFDAEDEVAWHEYGLVMLNLARLVYDVAIPEKSRFYYDQAEMKLTLALALGCQASAYSLAGLYAETNKLDLAMFHLEKAESYKVLPHIDELMQDERLIALHSTAAFQEFHARLTKPSEDLPF
jgi:tetratricopeptide (TPR) repeat protein